MITKTRARENERASVHQPQNDKSNKGCERERKKAIDDDILPGANLSEFFPPLKFDEELCDRSGRQQE
jgi:hypothetical protein